MKRFYWAAFIFLMVHGLIIYTYLHFAYDQSQPDELDLKIRAMNKATVSMSLEDCEKTRKMFIGGSNVITFNADEVYLNARPGQQFFIISTTSVTNLIWPSENKPFPSTIMQIVPLNVPYIPTNAVMMPNGQGRAIPN